MGGVERGKDRLKDAGWRIDFAFRGGKGSGLIIGGLMNNDLGIFNGNCYLYMFYSSIKT